MYHNNNASINYNIKFDFPTIMKTGDNYADWQPGYIMNKKLREDAKIMTNNDYRQYLINNADKIIKYNQMQASDECCSSLALYGNIQSFNAPTNVPFLYNSINDKRVPFGDEKSDLKDFYLRSQLIKQNMILPLLSHEQLMSLKINNN